MEFISSPNNDRVKNVAKLAQSAKERKYAGKYIVEGLRMVQEIPMDALDSIYFTQEFFDKHIMTNDRLILLVNSALDRGRCFKVTDQVIKKMTNTETPQGIVAVVKMRNSALEDILGDGSEKPLILILERIQDPGNMGTIIRSAEGAGVTGILVSYDSVDIYSPKVVRSTMGSIFRKNIVTTFDLIGDIGRLREHGVEIYGMHLNGSSMYEADLTKPVAFLIGNEGAGLSDAVSKTASSLIRIPMKGEVESLNAAISATLITYEALRQRDSHVELSRFY